LKDSTPTDIIYDVQGIIKWHGITISCTRQDAVLIPARSAKVFYIKIKNPKVNGISCACTLAMIYRKCSNEESRQKSIY